MIWGYHDFWKHPDFFKTFSKNPSERANPSECFLEKIYQGAIHARWIFQWFFRGNSCGKNRVSTPRKINMEPKNHPFIKEDDLPNLHDYVPC